MTTTAEFEAVPMHRQIRLRDVQWSALIEMRQGAALRPRKDQNWDSHHSWTRDLVENGLAVISTPGTEEEDQRPSIVITDKGKKFTDSMFQYEYLASRDAESEARLDKLLELFDEKVEAMKSDFPTYHVEIALKCLLRRWKAQLPDPNDYFHKAFRQADVLPTGDEDMAMWHLLAASRLFWIAIGELRGRDTDV